MPGQPEQIADELQLWFENGGADGFNIMPQLMSEGFSDFVQNVIPILQNRGLLEQNIQVKPCEAILGCPFRTKFKMFIQQGKLKKNPAQVNFSGVLLFGLINGYLYSFKTFSI